MGVVVVIEAEAEVVLIVTNLDPAEMSDRPIQPKLQHIAGPSSSNDNILVNDSRDDTYVSSMVEPLEKMDKGSLLHTDKQSLEMFNILCENVNKNDSRSTNVVSS